MKNRIKLLLIWYELQGENLIAEEELTAMNIDEVLTLFEVPFWNGLYHCWAVEKRHVKTLQPHLMHPIQPQLYAYFLEATKLNIEATE